MHISKIIALASFWFIIMQRFAKFSLNLASFGKAVATSAGVILGFSPTFFTYLAVIFFSCLYLTSMISFSSVTAAISAIVGVTIFPLFSFLLPHYDTLFTMIVLVLALIIIIRHKDNIRRIRIRQENLIPFGLNITKQQPKNK